jgi:nitroimidazol reductase NimA-like FMN-containing flavoprotein (pyridoxamine 5'-phosphate oxidase superfamily)
VDIEPIHYVYDGGWIYGRTGQGTKLATIASQRLVAFEVDEVRALFDWRSVVVKGAFTLIELDTPVERGPAFAHGVELLRALVPDTLRANDSASFRSSVFRIHGAEITGREASPAH